MESKSYKLKDILAHFNIDTNIELYGNGHINDTYLCETAPRFILDKEHEIRMNIIKRTYENAVAKGDKNVYFISGRDLLVLCGNEGTVDRIHPTDFGFASMAMVLGDLIEENKLI